MLRFNVSQRRCRVCALHKFQSLSFNSFQSISESSRTLRDAILVRLILMIRCVKAPYGCYHTYEREYMHPVDSIAAFGPRFSMFYSKSLSCSLVSRVLINLKLTYHLMRHCCRPRRLPIFSATMVQNTSRSASLP